MSRLVWWDPEDEKHQMGVWKTVIMVVLMAVVYQWVIPRLFPAVVAGRHTVAVPSSQQAGNNAAANREYGRSVVEGDRSEATMSHHDGNVNEITIRGNMLSSSSGMSRTRAKAVQRKSSMEESNV